MQCYKYLTVTATTWDQAARACNQNNGTLPIISLAVAAAAYAKSKDTQLTIWKYFQIWRFVIICYVLLCLILYVTVELV